MAELDDLQRQLNLAKGVLGAPESAKLRLRAELERSGILRSAAEHGPASLGATVPLVAPSGVSAKSASVLSRVLGHRLATWTAALLAGITFGAGYWLGHGDSLRPAAPVQSAAVDHLESSVDDDLASLHGPPSAPEADSAASLLEPVGAASPSSDTAPASRSRTRSSSRSRGAHSASHSLGVALALLHRTERAIRAHDPALALALLAELDRAAPSATLREERRTARILAECEQGSEPDTRIMTENTRRGSPARARAEQFLREQPSSVYSDRIRDICEIDLVQGTASTNSEKPSNGGH
jgi:hypothetical protein